MLVKTREEISIYHSSEQSQEWRNERGDPLIQFLNKTVLFYSSGYPTASVTLCKHIYVHMSGLNDMVKHQQPLLIA